METMKKLENMYGLRRRKGAGAAFIFLLTPLFFGACTQDPIFYNISQEVSLLEPRIKGTPTNIVSLDGNIYVANRSSLHRYGRPAADQDPDWDRPPQPAGEIRGLAATNDYLYALIGDDLKRLHKDKITEEGSWEPVNIDDTDAIAYNYPFLHKIYADSQRLFAGSGNGAPGSNSGNYAILYVDEAENKLKGLKDGVHFLSGAAFNGTKHFLSTAGSGIYVAEEPLGTGAFLGPIPNSADSNDTSRNITGIITLGGNTVAAVDRNGHILTVTDSAFTVWKKALVI
jgi:hypothetical protein